MADTTTTGKIGKFTLNHKNKFEIDISGQTSLDNVDKANWMRLAAGVNNSTPAANDTTTNDEYYDGEGFGTSDVTSKRLQITLAGHRLEGDPAQDYIASKQLAIGDDLKTLFRWTQPSGDTITGVVTLTSIVSSGGAPGAKQTFSVVIVFNGKPIFAPSAKVAVTSVIVTPPTDSVKVGNTVKLSTAVTPDNAADKTVTYESSDNLTATVTSDGTVTGIKVGSATITATAGDKSGKSVITVTTA
ncbi:Ig-like domain-containing protein [Loigolactobacillus coryniformis]|uniref:phage tail tube protein n=1 Tax=Loigolactobacillus coryniformis TaxID=1610 RepID=UPI003F24D81A